jgi:hypothetical protein
MQRAYLKDAWSDEHLPLAFLSINSTQNRAGALRFPSHGIRDEENRPSVKVTQKVAVGTALPTSTPGLGEHEFQSLDLEHPDLCLAPGLGQYLAQCEDQRMRGDKVLGKRIGGELYA